MNTATAPRLEAPPEDTRWPRPALIGFRFAFAYIALYTFPFPFSPPSQPPSWLRALWLQVAPWVGAHVLGTVVRPAFGDLGDAAEEYVRILVLFFLALLIALVWSIAGRRGLNYAHLHEWLRIYVRLFLGSEMIGYGMVKLWPVQFQTPTFSTLLARFGELSPSYLLWGAMGASRIYTVFAGLTEVIAGLLLFVPGLETAGALLSGAALANVLFLNLGYDVNVKQYSLHLLLLSGFLLLPALPSLAGFFIFHRSAPAASPQLRFRRVWLNRALLIFQIAFGVYFLAREGVSARREVLRYEQAVRNIPFSGVWIVDDFRMNGEALPPLLTDNQRWWRIIIEPDPFDASPDLIIEMASGVRRYFYAAFENRATSVKLQAVNDDRKWFPERFRGQPPLPVIANLRLNNSGSDALRIEGDFEGRVLQALLHRTTTKSLLLERGFHWINERPFWPR